MWSTESQEESGFRAALLSVTNEVSYLMER